MQPARRFAVLASLGALVAVLLTGCGNDGPAEETAGGGGPAGTDASSDPSGSTGEDIAPDGGCDLPEGLLARFNQQRQLLLSVASAGGDNLDVIQSANPLEPETFRSVADVLDGLDLAGVAPNPQFDGPQDVVADLHRTADLLQAALDAGSDTADPAWQELAEFVTPEFFTRHGASVNYYLSEAGCV